MVKKELEPIQSLYINSLREKESEETIKNLIVNDLLHVLGYKKEWFKYEEPNMLGRSDIIINTPNSGIIYLETKSKNYKITQKDYSQLSSYMDSTNTEWGIITNGKHYYLLNKSVNGKSEERVVLEYLLIYEQGFKYSKKQNDINLGYFSYENIFIKNSTKYFAYFKEYTLKTRNNSRNASFMQYQSANFNFFNYLNDTERICDNSLLCPIRLQNYFYYIVSKKTFSKDTLISKCRYIISVLKYLESCGKLQTKYFNNFNSEHFLSSILTEHCEDTSQTISPLTVDEANSLLNYYSHYPATRSRNKFLFKLYLFICPSIDVISNLTLNDLKLKDNKIYLYLNKYKFELPSSIINDYNEYMAFRKRKGVECDYLFYTVYAKGYNKISNNTIMSVINDCFNNISTISKERRKQLNISTIQKSVITQMLHTGFSIEQISLFTGLGAGAIYNYIDDETFKIISKKSNYLLMNKHPYKEILF